MDLDFGSLFSHFYRNRVAFDISGSVSGMNLSTFLNRARVRQALSHSPDIVVLQLPDNNVFALNDRFCTLPHVFHPSHYSTQQVMDSSAATAYAVVNLVEEAVSDLRRNGTVVYVSQLFPRFVDLVPSTSRSFAYRVTNYNIIAHMVNCKLAENDWFVHVGI